MLIPALKKNDREKRPDIKQMSPQKLNLSTLVAMKDNCSDEPY